MCDDKPFISLNLYVADSITGVWIHKVDFTVGLPLVWMNNGTRFHSLSYIWQKSCSISLVYNIQVGDCRLVGCVRVRIPKAFRLSSTVVFCFMIEQALVDLYPYILPAKLYMGVCSNLLEKHHGCTGTLGSSTMSTYFTAAFILVW